MHVLWQRANMPVNVETISFAINQPNQPDTQARQIHFEFMSNFYSYSPLISLELFKVHKSYNLNLIGKEEASCLCKPIYIYELGKKYWYTSCILETELWRFLKFLTVAIKAKLLGMHMRDMQHRNASVIMCFDDYIVHSKFKACS